MSFHAALIMSVGISVSAQPTWNYTKCPHTWEVRAPHIADFDISELPGLYYEIAVHDFTQYPACPSSPKCLFTNKTLHRHPDGTLYVNDTYNIHCLGLDFPLTLLENTTAQAGELVVVPYNIDFPFVPPHLLSNVAIPDSIVDFKPGPDGWVIEFQCMDHVGSVGAEHGHIFFAAVQFEAKRKDDETAYQEMLAVAKARGLDFFFNKGTGLRRVDHSNCPTEPHSVQAQPTVLL